MLEVKALENLYRINAHMRAFAIIVDYLNQQAEAFYIKFGFEKLHSVQGKTRLFISMKKNIKLFSRE